MNNLKELQQDRFFYYFMELSKIPHSSGNTKNISDFCVKFAKENNLSYIQDENNNVIIKKNAQGVKTSETVIIQGHLDMVCEKENGVAFDFTKDSLNLDIKDDFIFAKGTTLGADDGIAIAYALAVLEDKNIIHPNIEAVFTVDEEIGLLGAQSIDLSTLKGNMLLNIDSEDEGIITVSCAGGATVKCELPLEYKEVTGNKYYVKIHGLKGGHSGVEIDKYRANSNNLALRLLYKIYKVCPFNLVNIAGGLKDNAIPNLTEFEIIVDKNIDEIINSFYIDVKNEYRISDDGIIIDYTSKEEKSLALSDTSTKKAIFMLLGMPYGIINMDLEIKGLVKTSLNMGILKTEDSKLNFSISVRSSLKSEKEALIDKISSVVYLAGGTVVVLGDYSPWEYNPTSRLREIVLNVYKKMYNKEPKFKAIHAGLECGVLGEKIKNLDAISFGPDIFDIHTPKERLSISSTKRVWEFLLEILKNIK